jgi:hypothetical protein
MHRSQGAVPGPVRLLVRLRAMIITTTAKKNAVRSVSIPSFQASRLISLTRCEDSWPSQFALEFRGMVRGYRYSRADSVSSDTPP